MGGLFFTLGAETLRFLGEILAHPLIGRLRNIVRQIGPHNAQIHHFHPKSLHVLAAASARFLHGHARCAIGLSVHIGLNLLHNFSAFGGEQIIQRMGGQHPTHAGKHNAIQAIIQVRFVLHRLVKLHRIDNAVTHERINHHALIHIGLAVFGNEFGRLRLKFQNAFIEHHHGLNEGQLGMQPRLFHHAGNFAELQNQRLLRLRQNK